MATKTPEDGREYKVGDQIKVKLHDGRKVDATIRKVFQQDDETKLNIDYGHEETPTD
jgi:transcriptional regulator